MLTFDLLETQAESDVLKSDKNYGVLVVKNNIPQLFIPILQEDVEGLETMIRIDPNHVEEIRKTTHVYYGIVDDELIFTVDEKLF